MAVLVHIASVWVPFTSESKEAIASYPEILKEMRLGLQECGGASAPTSARASACATSSRSAATSRSTSRTSASRCRRSSTSPIAQRDDTVKTLEDVLHKSRKF